MLNITLSDGNQVTWLVGLDNVYRFSPGRYGIPAAVKGSWESDNAFVIYLDEIGNINQWRIRTTFEDERVTVRMQEMMGLGDITFGGNLEK